MLKLLFPTLFLIAAIGGFFLYTNPTYKEAKVNNMELAKITDALKKANQLREVRDKLATERNNISDVDINRINKMIPDSVENIGLIIELNNIARDKGMELLNPTITEAAAVAAATAPGVGPDNKSYGSINMSFSVSTTYERFIELLQELERTLRLVDVVSVSFGAPDPKTGISTFSITIQTYWLK